MTTDRKTFSRARSAAPARILRSFCILRAFCLSGFLLLSLCLLLSGCGKKESAEGLMKQAGEITGFRGVLTAELLTRGKTEDHPSRFQGTLESVPGELYLTGDSFMGDRQSEDRKNYYRQIPGEEKLEFCTFRVLDEVWDRKILQQKLTGLAAMLEKAEDARLAQASKEDAFLRVDCLLPPAAAEDCLKLSSAGMTFSALMKLLPEDARFSCSLTFRRDGGALQSLELKTPEGLSVSGKEIVSCRFFLKLTDTGVTHLELPPDL